MRDPFDEPISIVEELDPDPEPTGRWVHLREMVLGLLLVVGVLAWGGWDWWYQDQQTAKYRIAQEAAIAQDWDRALEYFSMLDGFKDASTRANEMRELVSERDEQYEIASTSAENEQWAATLKAAQAVRRVQRDYRDTGDLEAQASREVYLDALQGVVALRTQGRLPGLHYRSVSRWEWLPRSDRHSRVLRTLDSSGAVVYDVPGENWDAMKLTPTATAAPTSLRTTGNPQLKGRTLRVTWPSSEGGSREVGVNFDPSEHNFYWVGEKGMWAFRTDNRTGIRSRPRVLMGYGGIKVAYQPFNSSKTAEVAVQPGWVAMDFAPDGEHILLVDEGPSADWEASLKVYLADAYGSNRKLIATQQGSIQGVQFSPDSKYALLTTHTYNPSTDSDVYSVILIDLQTTAARTLVERSLKYEPNRNRYPLMVAGAFVEEGRFKGDILVTDATGERGRVYLFAPQRPPAMLNLQVDAVPTGSIYVTGGEESTIFVWQEDPGTFETGTPLVTLEIEPDWALTKQALPVEGDGFLAFAGVRDRWLIYGSREYGGGGGRLNLYNIFSVPLTDMGKQQKMPDPLYSAGLPDVSGFAFARAIYPGSGMLAYTDKGDLHVRTYDGSVDLILEKGVQHLYDPLYNVSWVQLR